jgi:hypothetical protein
LTSHKAVVAAYVDGFRRTETFHINLAGPGDAMFTAPGA